MPVLSDAVASSLITADERDLGVWLRRAVSVIAWRRCHLVCHWLQAHLPSERRTLGPSEPASGSATTISTDVALSTEQTVTARLWASRHGTARYCALGGPAIDLDPAESMGLEV